MIRRRRGAALIALAATALALGLAGCGEDDDGGDLAAIGFSQIADSGVSGEVDLVQDGNRVTGYVEVSGLKPNTAHAMHVHGVTGEDHGCAEDERTTNHMINLPDIEADDQGVGRLEVDVEGPADAVRDGTYIMVHQNPGMPEADAGAEDGSDGAQDATSEAQIILVHAGEDHGTPEEADAHKMGDNPPIACAEFTDQ